MPSLKIIRPSQYVSVMRDYKIWLDGVKIGGIFHDSTFEIEVTPGEHRLRLSIDWCSSKTETFLARADEAVIYEVRSANAFAAMFYIVFRPHRLLVLSRI